MNKINILKTLASEGALKYPELKALAGYKERRHRGIFLEHMLQLLRKSKIALNKSDRTYSIKNSKCKNESIVSSKRLIIWGQEVCTWYQ